MPANVRLYTYIKTAAGVLYRGVGCAYVVATGPRTESSSVASSCRASLASPLDASGARSAGVVVAATPGASFTLTHAHTHAHAHTPANTSQVVGANDAPQSGAPAGASSSSLT
jgi:hypothetical protein